VSRVPASENNHFFDFVEVVVFGFLAVFVIGFLAALGLPVAFFLRIVDFSFVVDADFFTCFFFPPCWYVLGVEPLTACTNEFP
jgi:hypothetical protein